VLDLDPGNIAPAPKIGARLRTDFIRGMGRRDDRFVIILDIDKMFSTNELALVKQNNVADEAGNESGS